jgi:hypothetical protein
MENPKAQGADIEEIKQRQVTMEETLRLLNWTHDSFDKGAISDRLSVVDAIRDARRLDASELFDEVHSHVDPGGQRQAAVAGVAAVAIRFGQSTSADDLDWAAHACSRAWLTCEASDDFFFRGSALLHHPVLFACRGLAGLLQHEAFRQQALEALIQLTAHPYDQVVAEALTGMLSSWSNEPAIAWTALRWQTRLLLLSTIRTTSRQLIAKNVNMRAWSGPSRPRWRNVRTWTCRWHLCLICLQHGSKTPMVRRLFEASEAGMWWPSGNILRLICILTFSRRFCQAFPSTRQCKTECDVRCFSRGAMNWSRGLSSGCARRGRTASQMRLRLMRSRFLIGAASCTAFSHR